MKLLAQVCFILLILISCGTKNERTEERKKSTPQTAKSPTIFDYQPRKPVNGNLYAVIELGALGLNYFVVEIDNQNRWRLDKATYGRSNIIYGVNTANEIIKNITVFKSEILKHGVKKSNIHLLASSSTLNANVVQELEKHLTSVNLSIHYISAKEEAQFALEATIPHEFIDESFIVDVGSGNTKLSWVENGDTLTTEIHGSKYFLGDVQDTTVFRVVRNALLEIPEKNRNLCFMLGGMIYEFVKDEVESKDQRYFVLKPPGEYPSDNEKLKAGNVIYNALYLEPTYSYIFDSKSNFSIGYLLNKNK